ncbi:MAG: hypothetical protein MJE77_40190 [Proteobacteria bacterium]|nr:hypothetical protein [Pseudomonadota bacterium]
MIAAMVLRPGRRASAAVFAMTAMALMATVMACFGNTGTIAVTLVAAPGSELVARVDRVRLTLSDPLAVFEAERGDDGRISLDLDVVASGQTGYLTFEGFDRSGELIAYGRSGPLPIAAISAEVVIYVAPPGGLAAAPVVLEPARSEMAVAALSFGVVLAGGRRGDGQVAAEVDIYSVYDHDLVPEGSAIEHRVVDLPVPRAGLAALAGGFDDVYLAGGVDDNGEPTPDIWRLVTSVAPRGAYLPLTSQERFARSGIRMAMHGGDVVVTGVPPLFIDRLTGQIREIADPAALGGTATSSIDGAYTLFAGEGNGTEGAVLLRGGVFVDVEGAGELARTGHAAVFLLDGSILAVAGAIAGELVTSAVRYLPATGDIELLSDFLATARRDAAVAASGDYVVVAGGVDSDGKLVADAEVFVADTLERAASVPMIVPRRGANAALLANGQILIAGGIDAMGRPIEVIELFTPAP